MTATIARVADDRLRGGLAILGLSATGVFLLELGGVTGDLGAILHGDVDAEVAVVAKEGGVARDGQGAGNDDVVTISDLDAAKLICIADGGRVLARAATGRRGRAAAAVRTSRDGEQHDREDGNPSQGVLHAVLLQMLGGARARCPRKVGRIIVGAPHRVQGLCAGVTCSPVRSGWFIPGRSGEVALHGRPIVRSGPNAPA